MTLEARRHLYANETRSAFPRYHHCWRSLANVVGTQRDTTQPLDR
ncbi:hypothetical protein ACVWYH_005464 [Bradyrhizobium sp. GM24.11]